MRSSSRGIAPTIIAVVIVVIIAVAAGAVYFSGALTPSSNTTHGSTSATTQPSSSSTTSAGTSSSSAASSTSTSTSSVSSTSSTSSQSPTTTISTFSCTSTYATTTTGTPVDYTAQYINLVAKFSAVTFRISETNGTSSQNSTIGYQTTTVSSGIYDVTVTITSSSGTESVVARVDSNNESVISVTTSGYTFFGAQAKSFFDGFMALFGLEYTYGGYLGVFTASNYFHSTGTAPMTYGSTTFDVTTWVANSLPLTVNECGYTSTITAFTLEVGTPPGTSLTFITLLHFASSSPQKSDVTFQLVSMTVG